ncbi:hypothetical protein EV640_105172 [Nesterenkonia aurantiaca]|uniref:Uncharacterized protein n=1 Tax=Nesterenkonia aurantiaca TaxID=1436010 RepID=A0A4R7G376_9MICC|nr:hypothetical protein EV640_105172 [Nesterenkonia aurantiaca]
MAVRYSSATEAMHERLFEGITLVLGASGRTRIPAGRDA